MLDENKVTIEIDIEDNDFKSKVSKATDGINKLSGGGSSGFRSMAEAAIGLNQSLELLSKGFDLLGGIMKSVFLDSVKESMEAEKSITNMNLALSNAGYYSKSTSSSMLDFAEGLSKISMFSADSIVQLESMAINMTKTEEQAKKVTKAAIELSSATGKDVNQSMQILSMSMEGVVNRGLDKMIPGLSKLTKEQLKAGEAADLIIKKFGGSGLIQMQTFSGRVTTMKKSFNELHESIGNIITQSPIINRAIEGITTIIEKVTKMVEDWAKNDGLNKLLSNFVGFGKAINEYVVVPLELAYNVVNLFYNSFVHAINSIIHALSFVGNAMVQSIIFPIRFVLEQVASLVGTFSKDLSGKINQGLENTLGAVTNFTSTLAKSTSDVVDDSRKTMKESFDNLFNFSFSAGLENNLTELKTFFEGAKAPLDGIQNKVSTVTSEIVTLGSSISIVTKGMKEAIKDLNTDASKNFDQLGRNIVKGFGSAVSSSFASFGKALAEGKNAAEAFANNFISVIGSMLVQLGEGYILQGIAASANPLTPGVGGPLIAAGAALATFGGLLSGLGGGGGSSSSGGSSESASASGPATAPASPDSAPQQKAEPLDRKQASIIINGDFLNSRETANHLAEVIRQNSDITDYSITAQGRNYG